MQIALLIFNIQQQYPQVRYPNQIFRDTISILDQDNNRTDISVLVTVAASENALGAVIIDGDYLLSDQDTLQVVLGGTGYGQHDALLVRGSATFNGRLEVVLDEGYTPKPGDSFTFTMAESIIGQFDSIILPDIGDNEINVSIQDNYALVTVDSPIAPATPLPIVTRTDVDGSDDALTLEIELSLTTAFQNIAEPQASLLKNDVTYDVFVAAFLPGGSGTIVGLDHDVWYLLDATETWGEYLGGPLAQFLSNIELETEEFKLVLSLLRAFDTRNLSGATFFIGFGTSEQEMLESERYRAVFVLGESQVIEP